MAEINQLNNEIIEESQKIAQSALKEAEHEAARILDDTKLEINRINKIAMDHRNKIEEQEIQREMSQVRIKNQIELNNMKNQVLENVMKESLNRITELWVKKDEFYRSALINLIEQGGIALDGGSLIIEVAKDDISLVDVKKLESEITGTIKNKTTLTIVENNLIKGGAIIQKENMTVYNTIDAIFDRRKSTIRNKLNKILFGK